MMMPSNRAPLAATLVVLALTATPSLVLAQTVVIYSSGTSPSTDSIRTYIEAENFCLSVGSRLATLDELCVGGEGGPPIDGLVSGFWVPYSGAAVPDPNGGASANTWIYWTTGGTCYSHHTNHGTYPSWGLVATGALSSRPVTHLHSPP
jgi:hypothetical protein